MTLSRSTQAFVPLLLAPLVALWLESTGNDKAPAFIIPWMAFAVVYGIAFRLLSPHVKHTGVLTLAAVMAAIAGGLALTAVTVGLLKANAGD
jgi:hypothetical protein